MQHLSASGTRRKQVYTSAAEEAPKKEAGTAAAEEAPKKEAGTAAEETLNEQPPGAPADQQPAILPQMDWPLAHKTIKCVVREYMPDPENGETIVIDRIRAEVYKRFERQGAKSAL